MTSPPTRFDVWRPTDGRPYAWASCDLCDDPMDVIYFGPVYGVTEQEAFNAASNWARDHRCHPAGRALAAAKAANWADEYLCDKQMGQYEETPR